MPRTLIHIPIIHGEADMGALKKTIQRAGIQKLGVTAWKHKSDFINNLWNEIEETIEGFSLSYERVRVYQDGLPVCGMEEKIVTDMAKTGSRNYRLLLRLREKGAVIMGTESTELLIEEYNFLKQILATESTSAPHQKAPLENSSDALLKKRDKYIAERINATLGAEETGILFLGLLHSLDNLLAQDIHVIFPLNRYHDLQQRQK